MSEKIINKPNKLESTDERDEIYKFIMTLSSSGLTREEIEEAIVNTYILPTYLT